MYQVLANLILIFHVGYVSFVVLGLVAILVGWARGWQWVRNPWFRLVHIFAIVFVAAETVIGMTCPLTTWENYYRALAGQSTVEGDIIAHYLRRLIFLPIPDTHWFFKVLYFGFAGLILATFFLVPPDWSKLAFPKLHRSNK